MAPEWGSASRCSLSGRGGGEEDVEEEEPWRKGWWWWWEERWWCWGDWEDWECISATLCCDDMKGEL